MNTTLISRLRTADYVLNLLMEIDAAGEAVETQRRYCAELRAAVNEVVPDSDGYEAFENNVVAVI